MSALGTFVECIDAPDDGLTLSDQNVRRGTVVSVGEGVGLPIKSGDIVLFATPQMMQYSINGVMHYFVPDKSVITTL